MRSNANRKYMLALGSLMLVGTGGIVLLNAASPGLCPRYPVIGLPACVVVLGYFGLMFSALFIADDRSGGWLFYGSGALALATGISFSLTELTLAGPQCPQVFGIPLPLCFTVPLMVALMLHWAWSGRLNPAATNTPR